MIFLAKPGAVVDIEEKENDDDALESEIDICKNCQSTNCKDGKFVTKDSLANLGSKVAYCGKSPNLIDKGGIVKGFSSDHVFINWDGSSETMGCFLFLETDGVLEPQFRFECKTKVIGQTLECEYCHCFPCNDGKYLTYFKATNIGIKVEGHRMFKKPSEVGTMQKQIQEY